MKPYIFIYIAYLAKLDNEHEKSTRIVYIRIKILKKYLSSVVMTDHLEKSNSKVDDFIVYSLLEMGFAVMRVPFFILITYSHTGMFSPTLRFSFHRW